MYHVNINKVLIKHHSTMHIFWYNAQNARKDRATNFPTWPLGLECRLRAFLSPPPSPTPVYVTLKYNILQLILVGQNKAANSKNCLILHLWNTLFLRARKLFQYKSSILLIALQAHKRINLFSGKLKNFCRGCSSVSPRWEYKHRKFWF